MHGLAVVVHVWIADDPDRMHALLAPGVDGIMTDRPTVLADVLRARGFDLALDAVRTVQVALQHGAAS